jgi:hypothetical protein
MKKDWKNLSDKELDEQFRNASQQHTFPFQPKDWELMQKKLDAPIGVFPFQQAWIWGMLLGLMLLLGLHMIGQDGRWDDKNNTVSSVESMPQPNITTPGNENAEPGKAVRAPSRFPQESMEPNSVTKNPSFQRQQFSFPKVKKQRVPEHEVSLPEQHPEIQPFRQEKAPPAAPTFSRFSLTLVASPDISAFRINEINGLGTNVGFYLEYFLNSNLSVVSGASYGNKIYRTSTTNGYGGYYPSSNRFWDGECQVLDIPVNFRYYAISRPQDRWYLSGGVSSYFMLREQYALTTESRGQVHTQRIDISNQNRHIFGIINLSIGYERQLHHKWALQIEPYFKLPITGIGEGEINLKSTGVWIGLKHRW